MIDLSGIARHLHLSPDQIRLAADLLEQGYAPTFISRYRADETGSLTRSVLWRLKLHIDHQKRLEAARQRATSQLPKDVGLDPEASRFIESAKTVVAIESVLKSFRARRALETSQERDSSAGRLLEKMLTYSGPAVENVTAWVSQEIQGDEEAGKTALSQVARLLGALIQGDTALNARLRHAIQRKASIRVEDPTIPGVASAKASSESVASGAVPHNTVPNIAASPSAAASESVEILQAAHSENVSATQAPQSASPLYESESPEDASQQSCVTDEPIEDFGVDARTADTNCSESATNGSESAIVDSKNADEEADLHDEEAHHEDSSDSANSTDESSTKSGNSKRGNTKLTPRQRRRRWLTSMLAPLRSIKKPLSKLTAYQHLMLGRGVRSQLIATPLDYDRTHLAEMARDCFADAKHPFAAWFQEAAASSLEGGLLAKLEAEALAELEEEASESLLEHATDELRLQLMRRPVRGHTVALVDTVGPKTVALVIVDPQGIVLASDELPCSVLPEVVNQNVVKLGELLHKHRVTLVALTNGPARRFMVGTLRELMVQSKDSGLRWTMADRSGAEAYAGGRIGLKELATFNRRERAAIWTARCLQNPLPELLKVDTGRLRLGSYQRELPQEPLKQLVHDTIVDCVCARGIDTLHASENELQYIPGVGSDQAKQIVKLAASGQLVNRSQLKDLVVDWPEMNQRQAMGWLRVFASTNTLDATLIHPEDYRLAERLIENTELSAPAAAPPGWTKRVPVTAEAPDCEKGESDSTTTSDPIADVVPDASGDANADLASADLASADSASVESSESLQMQEKSSDADPSEGSDKAAEPSAEELAFKPSSSPQPSATASPTIPPEYPEQIANSTASAPVVDAEKLAKQWQVGRAKLKTIAADLQDPFADPRLNETPVPLRVDMPTLDSLAPDTCVWAIVVGVADFGAFVELGPNCSGLIHISRLSTHFIEDPHQCVQVGDLLMTWVVNVDSKKNRVALTALSPAQRAEVQAAADQRKAQAEQERSNRYPPRSGDREPRRDASSGRGNRQGQGQAGQGQTGQRNMGQGQTGQGQTGQGNQIRRTESGGQRSGQFGGGAVRTGQQAGTGSGTVRQDRSAGRDRTTGRDRGHSGQGQSGRGRGRGGEHAGERPAKSVVVKSKKPVAPISQAMKEGDEPLRSFSDLLQFYESKRTTANEPEVVANESEIAAHESQIIQSREHLEVQPTSESDSAVEVTDESPSSTSAVADDPISQ